MNRPITSEVKNTDLKMAKELYMKYVTESPRQEQVDVTDAVTLQIKARR